MMNNIKNNFIAYSVSGQGALALIAIIVSLVMALSPISVLAYGSPSATYAYTEPQRPRDLSNLKQTYSDNSNNNYDNSNQNQNPIPYISSTTPSFVSSGNTSTMTVFGGNFIYGSLIKIDGVNYPTSFVNSGRLTTQVGYGNTANTGTHAITVWNPGPGGGMSNASYFSVNTGSVKGASVSKAKTTKTVVRSNTGTVAGASDTNYDYSALTSNAISGGNSFLPSGIMQWILFAILILLIVIILRKIFVGDSERNKPLKHA